MSEAPMIEQLEAKKIQRIDASAFVESADATWLSRLENLFPEKARKALGLSLEKIKEPAKKGVQKAALTGAALSYLISSGCGNIVEESIPPSTSTPAVYELSTGMPSANIEFTRTPTNTRNDTAFLKYLEEEGQKIPLPELKEKIEEHFQIKIPSLEEVKKIKWYFEVKPSFESEIIYVEPGRDQYLILAQDLSKLPPKLFPPVDIGDTIKLSDNNFFPFGPSEQPTEENTKAIVYGNNLSYLQERLGGDFHISQQEHDKIIAEGENINVPDKSRFQRVQFVFVDASELKFEPDQDKIYGYCKCNIYEGPRTEIQRVVLPDSFEGMDFSSTQITVHEVLHQAPLGHLKVYEPQYQTSVNEFLERNEGSKQFDPLVMSRLKYSLTSDHIWPVAAEFYLNGKAKFLEAYSSVFDQEQSTAFYNLIRDGIFSGKEYANDDLIAAEE